LLAESLEVHLVARLDPRLFRERFPGQVREALRGSRGER